MVRFILRYAGPLPVPPADFARIAGWPGVRIVDESTSRTLLVQAPAVGLGTLLDEMPGWIATQETMIDLPDPRFEIEPPAPVDEADNIEAMAFTALLDSIPGAFERSVEGRNEAEMGHTIPLEDLLKEGEPTAARTHERRPRSGRRFAAYPLRGRRLP